MWVSRSYPTVVRDNLFGTRRDKPPSIPNRLASVPNAASIVFPTYPALGSGGLEADEVHRWLDWFVSRGRAGYLPMSGLAREQCKPPNYPEDEIGTSRNGPAVFGRGRVDRHSRRPPCLFEFRYADEHGRSVLGLAFCRCLLRTIGDFGRLAGIARRLAPWRSASAGVAGVLETRKYPKSST